MLTAAIILFLVGALFGLIVLISILRDQPTPKTAVFIHGPLVATGLILVLITLYYGPHDTLLLVSASLFILAALGGLTLFTIDMSNKRIPKILAVGHPILAVIALLTLLYYVMY